MSETLKQEGVVDLEIAKSSYGNIVISQTDDTGSAIDSAIVLEPDKIEEFIKILRGYQK